MTPPRGFPVTQGPEQGDVAAERDPHLDLGDLQAAHAEKPLARQHQAPRHPLPPQGRIHREPAEIAAPILLLGDEAADRLIAFNREESAATRELGGDELRCLDEDARFRLEHAPVFAEGAAHDGEQRAGLRLRRGSDDRFGHRWTVAEPACDSQPAFRRGILNTDTPTDHQGRRYAIGLTLILLCATFFSLITTFSKFAYEAGSNPLTVVEVRSLAFILVVAVYQRLQGRGLILPRRTFIATFPMGLGILMMSVGYLSSVYFIKVSLAVVLLYSFPLLVGILAAVSGRERIRLPKALALLVAFAGLVMAIGLEGGSIDWRGIALVLMASLGIAGNLTFSGPYLDGVNSLTVNIWNNLWGALALGVFLALSGGIALPQTGFGWTMLGAVILCYILGLGLMFGALKYLPPSQAALMLNLEPVITIVVAVVWRHEALVPLQWLGVAIMLAALCFSALRGAKSEA